MVNNEEEKVALDHYRKTARGSYEREIQAIETMETDFDRELDEFYYYKFKSIEGEVEEGWIICRDAHVKKKYLLARGRSE